MPSTPTLLFLHGVGKGDLDGAWKVPLNETLLGLGYPGLDAVRVVAPQYSHALKDWDEKEPLPGVKVKQPPREAAKQNRRDFERRVGAVEFRLGRHDRGHVTPSIEGLVDAAVGVSLVLPLLEQARKYISDLQIRAHILNRILAQLPESGPIVIVGHSLGSVIAADLLRRLPQGVEVTGTVTIGSPLAHGGFDVDKLRTSMAEPPTNLAWWVNFWNFGDPVAAHRGVSSVFPWLIDLRINTKQLGIPAHAAVAYLADLVVAESIGFALFGSRSTDVEVFENSLDVPLDYPELLALVALRYANLMTSKLDGDKKNRYTGALRQVQATTIDLIAQRNASEKRQIPTPIARLAFDVSDPDASVPEPLPSFHLPKDEAVVLLTVLASENVIRPFEIELSRNLWRSAMQDLAAEMGLGSQFGTDVFEAGKRAHEALGGPRAVNWVKWGAIGVGAAAIVAATGGLALAAAPGLAGAAVITSALASFGPGGMIGGLLTAGTLATAGGGGIAFGLASAGTSAETFEAVIERRLTAEILRELQHLDSDPTVWRVLVETEMEVRREHERLDEFSDENSAGLKELKRKIEAVERALRYLRDQGLEPGTMPSTPDPFLGRITAFVRDGR
ncbi:hypothetical protein ITJ57_17085 [Plantibacter sp. VKM Ac-2880]|uniref:hypothetical protein n=1 Tax=Plantibacter sp. VKM Ac-2880 TaxID=2783827 RepID=UPI00188F52D0|nr:hypothetical protein [Plantibacter sp. VKM Ac-2880]MBF4570483.1 hypothetical protein [Plantibacter sp. VKM Ac-2880]